MHSLKTFLAEAANQPAIELSSLTPKDKISSKSKYTFKGKPLKASAKGLEIPGVNGTELKLSLSFSVEYGDRDIDVSINTTGTVTGLIVGGYATETAKVLQLVKFKTDESFIEEALIKNFTRKAREEFDITKREHKAWLKDAKKGFAREALLMYKAVDKKPEVDAAASLISNELQTNMKAEGFVFRDMEELW